MVSELLVELGEFVITGGLHARADLDLTTATRPQHRCPVLTGTRLGGESGDDGDRELETLRGVDGHHLHRVVVGLGEDGFGHSGALRGLAGRPFEVRPQAGAPGLAPRPGLIDYESQAAPQIACA